MDNWKYFDIVHRQHILCNVLSLEKFSELISLLKLPPQITPETILTILTLRR